ncbi:MAG: hypothetical protein IJR68_04720 [Fretibacterium sp.]|nr:hypothetical protein [Fretibacterium sp.]
MARGKKELGLELEKLIDNTFAKFEMYLPSPQDVAVYRRKRREYLDEITAALREGRVNDGRADGDAGSDGIDGSI